MPLDCECGIRGPALHLRTRRLPRSRWSKVGLSLGSAHGARSNRCCRSGNGGYRGERPQSWGRTYDGTGLPRRRARSVVPCLGERGLLSICKRHRRYHRRLPKRLVNAGITRRYSWTPPEQTGLSSDSLLERMRQSHRPIRLSSPAFSQCHREHRRNNI